MSTIRKGCARAVHPVHTRTARAILGLCLQCVVVCSAGGLLGLVGTLQQVVGIRSLRCRRSEERVVAGSTLQHHGLTLRNHRASLIGLALRQFSIDHLIRLCCHTGRHLQVAVAVVKRSIAHAADGQVNIVLVNLHIELNGLLRALVAGESWLITIIPDVALSLIIALDDSIAVLVERDRPLCSIGRCIITRLQIVVVTGQCQIHTALDACGECPCILLAAECQEVGLTLYQRHALVADCSVINFKVIIIVFCYRLLVLLVDQYVALAGLQTVGRRNLSERNGLGLSHRDVVLSRLGQFALTIAYGHLIFTSHVHVKSRELSLFRHVLFRSILIGCYYGCVEHERIAYHEFVLREAFHSNVSQRRLRCSLLQRYLGSRESNRSILACEGNAFRCALPCAVAICFNICLQVCCEVAASFRQDNLRQLIAVRSRELQRRAGCIHTDMLFVQIA